MEPVRLPLLTNSRAKSFRRCARHHLYAYEQGVRPVTKAGPLKFGAWFHLMLEAWWDAATDQLGVALAVLEDPHADELDAFDRVRAQELMLGYDARWGDEPLMVERVEAQFECELRNPETRRPSQTWMLAGKIDAIAKRDGRPWIVEHKTTSEDISPGSTYWQKLRLDTQVSTYFIGAESLGFAVEGCIYDVIKKPSMKPLEATPNDKRKYKADGTLYAAQRDRDETPEEFRERFRAYVSEHLIELFQRGDVVRMQGELDDATFDLWQTARLIREAELASRHPRNPDNCFQWSRPCDYWEVCIGAASIDDATKFRKAETPNEELTNADPIST
jgi:hypothetical protein